MILRAGKGMTSEVIAAVSKIMGNLDSFMPEAKINVTATWQYDDRAGAIFSPAGSSRTTRWTT
jgi:ethanolamine ammonia-lyase large subunit